MTDKEIVERAKEAEKRTGFGELVHSPVSKGVNSAYGVGFIEGMVEYRNSIQEEPYLNWKDMSLQEKKDLLASLQKDIEPASEDLEAAIDIYLSTYFGGEKEKQEWPFLKKMAIHFTNWHKQKNESKVLTEEQCRKIRDDAFELGKDAMKQQLMAKAVDAKACAVYPLRNCNEVHYSVQYPIGVLPQKDGDKVKVIIIKED